MFEFKPVFIIIASKTFVYRQNVEYLFYFQANTHS